LDFGVPKKRKEASKASSSRTDRFGTSLTNIPQSDVEKDWSFGDRLAVTIGGYEMTVLFVADGMSPGDFLATMASSDSWRSLTARIKRGVATRATPGCNVSVIKPDSKDISRHRTFHARKWMNGRSAS